MGNSVKQVMAIIYVSPGQNFIDIKEFIYRALFVDTEEASVIFSEYNTVLHKIQLILADDFKSTFLMKNPNH